MHLDKSPCCRAPTEPVQFSRYSVWRLGRAVVLHDATVYICAACHYGWPDPAQARMALREQQEVRAR
jgi:hypothetical protein